MAARPTWKGFLKVSLVTIPVRVYPATESSATISFNQLHEECQTRIQQKKWCPHVRARGDQRRGGQGLRVREGPLGGGARRGHRQGEDRVDQGHQPGPVRRRRRDRPDVRGQGLLPGARGADGRRRLRGDARRHGGEGRHRQGGDPRPRVPGGGQAAQAGAGDVHAAPRRRDSHHRPDRRAARGARQGRPRPKRSWPSR